MSNWFYCLKWNHKSFTKVYLEKLPCKRQAVILKSYQIWSSAGVCFEKFYLCLIKMPSQKKPLAFFGLSVKVKSCFFYFVFPKGILISISKTDEWKDFLRGDPKGNFERDSKGRLIILFDGQK